MKTFRQTLAVLIAAMLTLVVLTGCGGGSTIYCPPNEAVQTAVTSIFEQEGFAPVKDTAKLNTTTEKYISQIAKSPSTYLNYGTGNNSPIKTLQQQWMADCKKVSSAHYTLWALNPMPGSIDESSAVEKYQSNLKSSLEYFMNSIAEDQATGTYFYYVYPVHIANPSNPEDSVWMMFEILYCVLD